MNPDVLTVLPGVVRVTARDVDEVVARALRSPRGRARLCAHPTLTDPLHEMVVALTRRTYVRPHRHPGKSESFHLISGRLTVMLFDDDGRPRDLISLAPYATGGPFYYRLPEPWFHTVVVHDEVAVIHETTNGPFDPGSTEFAAWAPVEGTPAADDYLEELRRAVRGACPAAARGPLGPETS